MPQEPAAAAAKSLQSCPTVCDPIDGSLPGSPVPGILQARTLEWVAIAFSSQEPKRPQKGVLSNCEGPSQSVEDTWPPRENGLLCGAGSTTVYLVYCGL